MSTQADDTAYSLMYFWKCSDITVNTLCSKLCIRGVVGFTFNNYSSYVLLGSPFSIIYSIDCQVIFSAIKTDDSFFYQSKIVALNQVALSKTFAQVVATNIQFSYLNCIFSNVYIYQIFLSVISSTISIVNLSFYSRISGTTLRGLNALITNCIFSIVSTSNTFTFSDYQGGYNSINIDKRSPDGELWYSTIDNNGNTIYTKLQRPGNTVTSAKTLTDVNTIIGEIPIGTIDGSNRNFIPLNTIMQSTLEVYNNGKLLTIVNDYTISSSTIIFNNPPLINDIVTLNYNKI
jgi:hypothetical protein